MTATLGWFFAAARTIDGPPMSICSMHSSGAAPDATVSRERVQVDDHQLERGDAELGELALVVRQPQVREDPGVHRGVQRLHPAVQALGEPGQVLHLHHGDAQRGDPAGRRAGRDDLDAGGVESVASSSSPVLS